MLVNGSPTPKFVMDKGIRQGDPIGSFLFLVMAEGLSGLVKQAVVQHKFSPYDFDSVLQVQVGILPFADDTILMGEASTSNAFIVKCILRRLKLASGLKINFAKSNLVGICGDDRTIRSMAAILNCRIMRKLSKWTQNSLTFGGQLCLIKSVLSSLPLHLLSFFKMPPGILRKCNSIMLNFLSGGTDRYMKTAWVRWDKVCSPKSEGGLGVRNWRLLRLYGEMAMETDERGFWSFVAYFNSQV